MDMRILSSSDKKEEKRFEAIIKTLLNSSGVGLRD